MIVEMTRAATPVREASSETRSRGDGRHPAPLSTSSHRGCQDSPRTTAVTSRRLLLVPLTF